MESNVSNKKVFVTGATGFIGQNLCLFLANKGYIVHAFYRSAHKTAGLQHESIRLFKGDLLDQESLERAMKGCDYVFHLAALASVWAKDPSLFKKINYEATLNLLDIAIQFGVEKVVVVSTAGVFGPSENDVPVTEKTKRSVPYFSQYEKTKDEADQKIMSDHASKIHTSIVCPTRVYGPGRLSESNAVTKIIDLYSKGKFRFIPGDGSSVGNYVYIDDLVRGMYLTLLKGKSGERYLLGGENISFTTLFAALSTNIGNTYRQIKVPAILIIAAAHIMLFFSKLFKTRPKITPGWAKKYLYNWYISDQKARDELGYTSRSFKEGVKDTLDWIHQNNRK